jgi:hypothetical protein
MAGTNFPDPPRMFGDWSVDGPALSQWFKDLTAVTLRQVQTIEQLGGSAGSVDPNDLPDPASTNLATSQQTANDAYLAALGARANLVFAGQITINDAATSADATFSTSQADTHYSVTATLSATTGTPAAGSTSPSGIAKTITKATISVSPAPGLGNSVTFDVSVWRNT